MDQTTSITNAVTATSITVLGVATGLTYDVLLAGFAGGLVSLSYLGPVGIWSRIWTPITATLTAGYTAPILGRLVEKWIAGQVDTPTMDQPGLLVFTAFVIGLFAQALIPVITERMKKKAGSFGEQAK